MATIAQSVSGSRPAKAPISAHPAFPAIVALWFAALLGLGSLVLPVALIERLVTVAHISSFIPAAAPPLGFTARAGIALAASIAGAVVGLLLARKVAAASAPEPRARGFSVAAERQCRPISAPDELGEEGLDADPPAPSPLLQKRRSLAMSEDNRRSAYLAAVPLPGQAVEDQTDVPDAVTAPVAEPTTTGGADTEPEFEPLELGDFAAPDEGLDREPADIEADDGFETLRRSIHTPVASVAEESPLTDRTFAPAAFEPAHEHGEPLPFAAPSLRRSLAPAFDEEEQPDISQELDVEETSHDEVFVEESAPQLTIVEADGEPQSDERAVEELGLVQLAARLGASIEKRRAWLAQRQSGVPSAPASPALAPFGEAGDFEAAGAEDAARAIADFFGPAGAAGEEKAKQDFAAPRATPEPHSEPAVPQQPAIPASLRGVPVEQEDEEDEDAFAASFSLPLGATPAEQQPAQTSEGEEFDEEEAGDGDYSSLLAMKNPFARQQEFVRVEEPEDDSGSIEPAVTFPSVSPAAEEEDEGEEWDGSAPRLFDPPRTSVPSAPRLAPAAPPRDPGDAERSLRDALATLQRMSGAA